MLHLFRSIFRDTEEAGRYPESMVRAAIERAVDGTDPWLRGLSGYRKKLRPAVLTAIDHVVALVDGLEPPRPASVEDYDGNPLLQAIFLSSEQMRQVLHDQLAKQPVEGSVTCAMLAVEMELRGILGVDLVGDTLVRDVPQVTVSFSNHRLLDPTGSEAETRRLLKRRAFDHLLSLALRRMVAVKDVRKGLNNRQSLLQAKLYALQSGRWGFDSSESQQPESIAALETQLAEIEAQLQRVGKDDRSIEVALELLIDVLGLAQKHLWMSRETLAVDRMKIKRSTPSSEAPELELEHLYNAEGRNIVVALVGLS